MFIFSAYTFSSYFSHIFSYRATVWYDMFELVDFHRAEEVRNFFKSHIKKLLFFFLSWVRLQICIFALAINEEIILITS